MKLFAHLLIGLGLLHTHAASAAAKPAPLCAVVVQPELLNSKTGRQWLAGPGIKLPGDSLACNFYKKEPPGGLLLAVRNDPQRYEFEGAKRTHAGKMWTVKGFEEGFYFRHTTATPFETTWGLVVYDQKRIFRLEGIPEGKDAAAARALCREIIERTMRQFGNLQ